MGRQWEREYVSALVLDKFPDRRVILSCPLGPVPLEIVERLGMRTALRIGRGMRPVVDLLVYGDQEVILVEAKIYKWLDGISKLHTYRALVPDTPELAEQLGWPVRLILATPWLMEPMRVAAGRLGVELLEYHLPIADEYAAKMQTYWTAEAMQARYTRKRTIEALGL